MDKLRELIRDIPDFPKPGILFKDITPLLQNREGFKLAITEMARRVQPLKPNHIVAIESRGFIFGSALAIEMGLGLVLVRKPGKLPYQTQKVQYALEYGTDELHIHVDALSARDNALIVDDILATGGTAAATGQLVEKTGSKIAGYAFLSELGFLNGRERLSPHAVISLMSF